MRPTRRVAEPASETGYPGFAGVLDGRPGGNRGRSTSAYVAGGKLASRMPAGLVLKLLEADADSASGFPYFDFVSTTVYLILFSTGSSLAMLYPVFMGAGLVVGGNRTAMHHNCMNFFASLGVAAWSGYGYDNGGYQQLMVDGLFMLRYRLQSHHDTLICGVACLLGFVLPKILFMPETFDTR